MNLKFYNTPEPEDFNLAILPKEEPLFLSYVPNFELMQQVAEKFSNFKNLLLIGNGGSLNSFLAFHGVLKEKSFKKVYFLNTVDPDYISYLKNTLSPEDTVVVAATKSGENITQLESTLQFLNFPLVFVTGKGSPVEKLGNVLNAEVLEHPAVGGRYAGLTEVALLPALLCGFNVKELFNSAQQVYRQFAKDNKSWQLASVFWQLEQKEISDVFVPFYSKKLASFSQLVVQLCHESFGKGGLGQSYFGFEGPEWQHHSTQRFFGGIKNVASIFVTQDKFGQDLTTSIPEAVGDIGVRGGTLSDLNAIPLSKSMEFEYLANIEDSKAHLIPTAHLKVENLNEHSVGELTAFWQMYAVYGSLLRQVNPFDQPQVEFSKGESFQSRLNFKKS